ncbi:MAG: hypothetical protein JRD93_02890 [Deltaproteobacteria bacterium]|nr:hypothetical protein [Deltaproteobacteria bacterium]MBW2660943.1 hypothetical protein [Deltaproteobacteria bacterium]
MTRTDTIVRAAKVLRQAGIVNPTRLVKLIQDAIAFFQLDLSGQTVLTEAASGPYVVTPIIASLAGAKSVMALTRDSRYANVKDVIKQTRALEELCGVEHYIEIHTRPRSLDLFRQADIVTNLGFVRPIDAEVVKAMKATAVIPLMCEAWEFRPDDVDLLACQAKGVAVLGTNEDCPGLTVFDFSGSLCIKMLLEMKIEIYKNKIAVISSDKFGVVIEKYLKAVGAEVGRFENLKCNKTKKFLKDVDVVVIADYTSSEVFIGNGGQISGDELLELSPAISVLQFSGIVEVEQLDIVGIPYFPPYKVGAVRMGMTLADLGPKPVIDLHTAGLKVGELMVEARKLKDNGKCFEDTVVAEGAWAGLAQKVEC